MGVFRRTDRPGNPWIAEKQSGGLRVRSPCFREKWRAEEAHVAMTRAALSGTFYEEYGPASLGTVADLIDDYLFYCNSEKEVPNAESTLGDKRNHLTVIGNLLSGLRVDLITKFTVRQLKKDLRAGKGGASERKRSGPTVNRYLATLSDFMSWLEEDNRIKTNPVRRIRRYPENANAWSAPTEEEFALILAHSADDLLPSLPVILTVCYESGMRIASEVLRMRREHVDFGWRNGRGLITTSAAKRGKEGGIAMTHRLRVTLCKHVGLLPKSSEWLFPNADASGPIDYDRVYRAFRRTLKRCGLSGLRLHDLRHGFATRLGAAGATEAEIQNFLRQRTGWMTKRYVHLGEEHTAVAADRLDRATQSATQIQKSAPFEAIEDAQHADIKRFVEIAGVAELADAADLKSADLRSSGFESQPRHLFLDRPNAATRACHRVTTAPGR